MNDERCEAMEWRGDRLWRCRRERDHSGETVRLRESGRSATRLIPAHYFEVISR